MVTVEKKLVSSATPNRHVNLPIVFVSSVFEDVKQGPAIYARYLWESFSANSEFDFHLVTSSASVNDPNIHLSGTTDNSNELYRRLQKKALEVASRFDQPPIIHGNAAHSMNLFSEYRGQVIVQINDYDTATMARNPIKYLVRHGLRRTISRSWRWWQEKKVLKFADRVVCNSRYTSEVVQQQFRIPVNKIEVVHKAVDLEHFQQTSRSPNSVELMGTKRILFVGADWQRKGLDVAIGALAELKKDLEDWVLIVAGSQVSKQDRKIASLAQELSVADRVQFLGNVSRGDMPKIMRACNLFVLPSRQEAFGVAIIEALAAGLPVIAARVGGIPEILDRCKFSKVVPAESVGGLANAIHQFAENDDFMMAAKQEGPRVATEFSKQEMLEKVADLYLRLNQVSHGRVN